MAESLYYNGTIVTLDSGNPNPEAIVTKNGKILFVGSLEQARRIQNNAEWRDLQGRTMIPGFNDNHIHAVQLGNQLSMERLNGLSEKVIIAVLANRYGDGAGQEAIIGMGWDYPTCPNPNKSLLGKHFPDVPVVLFPATLPGLPRSTQTNLETTGMAGQKRTFSKNLPQK